MWINIITILDFDAPMHNNDPALYSLLFVFLFSAAKQTAKMRRDATRDSLFLIFLYNVEN